MYQYNLVNSYGTSIQYNIFNNIFNINEWILDILFLVCIILYEIKKTEVSTKHLILIIFS